MAERSDSGAPAAGYSLDGGHAAGRTGPGAVHSGLAPALVPLWFVRRRQPAVNRVQRSVCSLLAPAGNEMHRLCRRVPDQVQPPGCLEPGNMHGHGMPCPYRLLFLAAGPPSAVYLAGPDCSGAGTGAGIFRQSGSQPDLSASRPHLGRDHVQSGRRRCLPSGLAGGLAADHNQGYHRDP